MEVFSKANDLALYTIKICNNERIFVPEYRGAMTVDLIETAKGIFMDAWTANDIRVTDGETKRDRRKLQESAIRKCNRLLALMRLAQPLFHLKSKRIQYWGGMTLDVRNLLRAWKESDAKRYAEIS